MYALERTMPFPTVTKFESIPKIFFGWSIAFDVSADENAAYA
jgi:hypothetical protein